MHADPKGMVLADPTIRQSAGFQKPQIWNVLHEASHDAGGSVRGLIVHDQDFVNFRLARQGRDGRLLIPSRNNGRDGARGRRCDESSVRRWIVCVAVHSVLDAEGSFPGWGDWVSIAFDGNPSKNCGLGSAGGCAGGFATFRDAQLPPGRSLDCWKNSAGLSAGNRREARASDRSEGQGGGTEFLGDVVSAVRRG